MFEITIKEIKTETQSGGKEWKLIGPENGAVYGYTPEVEVQVEVETKILQQIVKDLDLPAVIKAINNI